MIVAFRADASLTIGTGHVMRCLTLADILKKSGSECVFLSRDHPGNLHRVVQDRGYKVLSLGKVDLALVEKTKVGYKDWLGVDVRADADDTRERLSCLSADWLIVDHYGLGSGWEQSIKECCGRIMAIDDLANRDHTVDALLDQNLGKTETDYEERVPPMCKLMIGPRYALLRPNFAALRTKSLSRRGKGYLRKLLITMGGVDLEDATGRVLDALKGWGPAASLRVTVVMGPNAPWRDKVRDQVRCLPFPTEVLVNVRNMETLMCEADLTIGAAGSTSWECCCMGLPALQLVVAENQRLIARAMNQAGAAESLSDWDGLNDSLHRVMSQIWNDPAMLVRMSSAAAQVTDGLGAERIAHFIKYDVEESITKGCNL